MRSRTFADLIEAEEASIQAGQAQACGFTCRCHGGLTCIRARHVHHGEHWRVGDTIHLPGDDIPDGAEHVPASRVPHVARTDGGLVQWSGPHQTDAQIGEGITQAKAAHLADLRQLRTQFAELAAVNANTNPGG